MKPRFASSVIDQESWAKQVFKADLDSWRSLPVQWRGFVLQHQRFGHTTKTVLDLKARGQITTEYDPQGVFDAYLGNSPQ